MFQCACARRTVVARSQPTENGNGTRAQLKFTPSSFKNVRACMHGRLFCVCVPFLLASAPYFSFVSLKMKWASDFNRTRKVSVGLFLLFCFSLRQIFYLRMHEKTMPKSKRKQINVSKRVRSVNAQCNGTKRLE